MGGDGVGVPAGGFGDLKRGIFTLPSFEIGEEGEGGEEMEMTTDWIDRQIGMRYEGDLDDEYGILIKS